MIIELTIDYWSAGVLCFDPEKVLAKVVKSLPRLVVNPTDWAEWEVEHVARDVQSRQLAEETRLVMLQQIKGKARRNGPVFNFHMVSDDGMTMNGHVSRYSIWIRIPAVIAPAYQDTIIDVLKSFGAGEICIRDDAAADSPSVGAPDS
jgi:hypothetical protein